MSVIVSHPTGNANVRAVLRSLQQAGLLAEFHTSLAFPNFSIPGLKDRFELTRRSFPEVAWRDIRQRPGLEFVRQLAQKVGMANLVTPETGFACVDAIYRDLDKSVAAKILRTPKRIDAVYAYEDGALDTFLAAKQYGISCIYELPIAHWRTLDRILTEEADLCPDWAPTIQGLSDSVMKRNRKDDEIRAADTVIVPSSFVRESVVSEFGDDVADVRVVPFGCPTPRVDRPAERKAGQAIKLFFAGQLTHRKGLGYLASALERLDVDWHLTMAGPLPNKVSSPLRALISNPRCDYVGRIPHKELLDAMTRAHAFVFPSLVEGFALVVPEAMSAGLPVILTPNAGADVIRDGKEGYKVPIRNSDAIADRITRLASDEDLRFSMAKSALATAARNPWSMYEIGVLNSIKTTLAKTR